MDSESDSEPEYKLGSRGKGKATEQKEIKRRSSKACDSCRKSKSKCSRAPGVTNKTIPLPPCDNCSVNGIVCTYTVSSKKRGPPKGYIEVLEGKLHRLESMLGKIVESKDPRTQSFLSEILGKEATQELLALELDSSTKQKPKGKRSASPTLVSTGFVLPPQSTLAFSLPPPMPTWPTNPFSAAPSTSSSHIETTALGSYPPSNFHSNLPPAPALPPSSLPSTIEPVYYPPVDSSGRSYSLPRDSQFGPSSSRWPKRRMSSSNPSQHLHTSRTDAITDQQDPQYASNAPGTCMRETEWTAPKEAVKRTELEDVLGQLSLNENEEVRYHGRSSGLYLIAKSSRYSNSYWRMPAAGLSTSKSRVKTEHEILEILQLPNPLPDLVTSQILLDIYWTHVHPHFPIVYRPSFERQWRYGLENPGSNAASTSSGRGKVPTVLLLTMYALAARYDLVQMERGEEYLENATKILNYDYASSRQVSVQVLLLLSYLAIGGGGSMSAAWLYSGMAIRIAEDLGINRSVENWSVSPFSEEEKESRKFVWYGCILMDRYVSSFIGRPGAIHERDYDTAFPSEKGVDEQFALSCFNASCALAVLINRIISSVYAIRVRVQGQSSDALLSLLDQSLASWYTALPAHLAYHPGMTQIPPPHVLNLHLQFYSALILLHRPFIPGQHSPDTLDDCFPSHSVCTTAANAITAIVSTFSTTFTLRHCPPTVIYPVFSAAIISVYNASFHDSLGEPAKTSLRICMDALREMSVTWESAARQWQLLVGLVDLTPSSDNPMASQSHPFPRPSVDQTQRASRPFLSPPPEHATSNTRGEHGARSLGRSDSAKRKRANSIKRSRESATGAGFVAAASTMPPPPTFLHNPFLSSATLVDPTQQYVTPPPHQSYQVLGDSMATPTAPEYSSTQTDYSLFLNPPATTPYSFAADSAFYGVPIGASTDLGDDDWSHLLAGYERPAL